MRDDGKIIPNGGELKKQRKQHGISQERLSEETGLALKTIRNLEGNLHYRCRPITINTLAQFYGIEAQMLIAEDMQSVQLLTSFQDIIEANTEIVATAQKVLVCIGSRSRDEGYLRQIETTLCERPALLYYRVMTWPPFKKLFQDHLLRLIELRKPTDRSYGYKTTHIGIYRNLEKQPECSLCANESEALIVLPSIFGMGEYNTAVLIRNASLVERFIAFAKFLYQAGDTIETTEAIRELGLLENGDEYE